MSQIEYQLPGTLLGIIGCQAYAVSKFIPGKPVVIITATSILGFMVALTMLALRLKNLGDFFKVLVLSLVAFISGTYLLLIGLFSLFQDTVANQTSSFFQPLTITEKAAEALISPDAQSLDLIAPDGMHLRGWLLHNTGPGQAPLLIYFGSSGSEASKIIPYAQTIEGWSVALVNYRGFGLSEGTPTHADILADALTIYDSLTQREDIDPNRVVTMGYSLGMDVAVFLSEQRPILGTVLVSAYDQWSLIGLNEAPIYAPLSGIMKPFFDSISRAPDIDTPLLCLIGSEDNQVPVERSLALVTAW